MLCRLMFEVATVKKYMANVHVAGCLLGNAAVIIYIAGAPSQRVAMGSGGLHFLGGRGLKWKHGGSSRADPDSGASASQTVLEQRLHMFESYAS